jgi:tetratricopeptide (TPR) repeat protein
MPAESLLDPLACIERGHKLVQRKLFEAAEQSFKLALELDAELPMAHNNLAWIRETQGDLEGAISGYRTALRLNNTFLLAANNLARLLSKLGRFQAAWPLWNMLIDTSPNDFQLLGTVVSVALSAGDLTRAAKYADRLVLGRRSSRWFPTPSEMLAANYPKFELLLNVHKLEHDIEQLCYLQRQGLLTAEFTPFIRSYECLVTRLLPWGKEAFMPFGEDERRRIGDVYNRIVHFRPALRVKRALGGGWRGELVEDAYRAHPNGIVVVDDLLSEEALTSLRQFCLQSTIWFTSNPHRYRFGRLGAFFADGFNCPLLLQIAEELQASLPRLIGNKHRLHQMWAFKYGYSQPNTGAHADFAAINVNFWITPDEANVDKQSGGMAIYNVEAPAHWNAESYNADGRKIEAFLTENAASRTRIPYRSNRAIIFNSDLFHATEPLQFRDGYENRRINVTLLYGRRADGIKGGF